MINRLRLGHTRVMHSCVTHILTMRVGLKDSRCALGVRWSYSIRHILIYCEALQNVRDMLETALKGRDVTVKRLIGEGGVVGNVLAFLREIGIYTEI